MKKKCVGYYILNCNLIALYLNMYLNMLLLNFAIDKYKKKIENIIRRPIKSADQA